MSVRLDLGCLQQYFGVPNTIPKALLSTAPFQNHTHMFRFCHGGSPLPGTNVWISCQLLSKISPLSLVWLKAIVV